jgi:pSer/pThr/pTyr-binding forkhead associated (FHA) protein
VFRLAAPETVIGKAADCGIVVDDDPYVSRCHARLVRADGHLLLFDAESSNGTLLRVRRPLPLDVGDEFMIGNTVFRVELET